MEGVTTIRNPIVQRHLINLMLSADSPNVTANEKEMKLIGVLESLLGDMNTNKVLDEIQLSCAEYKMSRVPCFAERYLHIVNYLRAYQQTRYARMLPSGE
ncbi:hypothetical protein GOV07_04695 [Candidatus Woesearchaeota archaeon]|nr:hypothetical protein [Candidatus Woesearchaeota archaeon]